MLVTKTVREFIDEVASHSPAPGGGSVAAMAGALGTALTTMVCRLTIGKKKYQDVQSEMESVANSAEQLRTQLTALVDEDTQVFHRVMAAFSLPKETEQEKLARSVSIQEATKAAALVPLKVMELCERGLALAQTVAEKGNVNSISDAGVAALMLQAACQGAALNVKINIATLQDEEFVKHATEEMESILSNVELTGKKTLARVYSALG
ncbi:MAG TPA: cyclodeaminase/cyclohydrolase family protein [Bacteroidota bacterium]|nr:cyclodeaminase/cyclohydrolase family protein [Bacteroidota bacterium]